MPSALSPPSAPRLRWTDYPLMDAALAGLCVFSGVRNPTLLTAEHLQTFQRWAEKAYFSPEMRAWISTVFTLNGFMNTNSQWTDEMRRDKLCELLTAYLKPNTLADSCAVFPELQAQQRVSRDLMPMLMGRGSMNFYPEGRSGLPLSGQAITALHGLSLAAPLVSGRMLVTEADDRALLLSIVENWQQTILSRVSISVLSGQRPLKLAAPRTRLVEVMREIMSKQPRVNKSTDITYQGGVNIYHLSNDGKSPNAHVYRLQHRVIAFMELSRQNFPVTWQALLRIFDHPGKNDNDPVWGKLNSLDEALFSLPDEAASFLRRYLMPPFSQALREAKAEAKKGKSSKKTNRNVPSPIPLAGLWGITELFLMEVVGMERARVEAIEALGQRLGKWIVTENDKRLFRELYEARGAGPLRRVLLKAMLEKSKEDARSGTEDRDLITTKDEYLRIFTEAEEVTRADFTLARDLLKMRVIQYLHDERFFEENRDDPELQNTELPDEEGEQ